MKKIEDLTKDQREQFEFFLRAEGFFNIVQEEELKETGTLFIKDKNLVILLNNGQKKEIKLKKYTTEEKINNTSEFCKIFFNKDTKINYELLDNTIIKDFLPGLFSRGFPSIQDCLFTYEIKIELPFIKGGKYMVDSFIASQAKSAYKYFYPSSGYVDISLDRSVYQNRGFTIFKEEIYKENAGCEIELNGVDPEKAWGNMPEKIKIYHTINTNNTIDWEFKNFFSPFSFWEINYIKKNEDKVKEVQTFIKLPQEELETFYKTNIKMLVNLSRQRRKMFLHKIETDSIMKIFFKALPENSTIKLLVDNDKFNSMLSNTIYEILTKNEINKLKSCPKDLKKFIEDVVASAI